MSIYFNPPLRIREVARELKPEGTFSSLAGQLKANERLFCLAYRGEYPQCIYLNSDDTYREYKSALWRNGRIDSYYAMSGEDWKIHFPNTPDRYWGQQGIVEKKQMIPVEDLFFQDERKGE